METNGRGDPATGASRGASRALLLGLLTLAAVALPVILIAGSSLEPEPELAGRYDVSAGQDCFGRAFDLRQSGQFISLSGPGGGRIARLRVEAGAISGEVNCIGGRTEPIDALASGTGIAGSIGGMRLKAERVRELGAIMGREPTNPSSIDGSYVLSPESVCLGRRLSLEGGDRPLLTTGDGPDDRLTYGQGRLRGEVSCRDGDEAELRGIATGDRLELELEQAAPSAGEQRVEQAVAELDRPFGDQAASFFLALAVVLGAARLVGAAALRVGQPRVMGEILAGILLGPTLLGALMPDLQAELFSADVLPVLGIVASFGLIIYMFVIGIELDPASHRGRGGDVVAVAAAGFVLPLLLGTAAALPIFELVAPETDFAPFALFIGISMSITALPVLARILEERGMLGGRVSTTALAAAAIDDLLAWLLITLATALALAGSAEAVLPTLAWTVAFGALMVGVIRPLLRRAAAAYDRDRSGGWIALVFGGILLSAYATEQIGVALIIGALAMGAVMPKRAALTNDVRRDSESFVSLLLLPLFFAFTGLRTDVGALGATELWLVAAALLVLAVAGKLGAVTVAARINGMGWRVSAMLGSLMNTRGLTELIVLNLALEIGVISEALFTALVLMALLTTFMAGPLLRMLDPGGRIGAVGRF